MIDGDRNNEDSSDAELISARNQIIESNATKKSEADNDSRTKEEQKPNLTTVTEERKSPYIV